MYKIYFYECFFLYIKMVNTWKISKSFWRRKRNNAEKGLETDPKIFLKKKKHQYHKERNKNLSEEEKEKKVDYVKKNII